MHDLAQENKIKVDIKPETVIEKFGSSQQGAAIFVDGAPTLDMKSLEKFDKSIVLMLDGIEDPHNLGAIVRTSWLTGTHGVLIPEDRAVGLTPTVHKVACGGWNTFRLKRPQISLSTQKSLRNKVIGSLA